jgi:hypothetical protein
MKKPKNLNKMLNITKTLANNFPFVRVDLYCINDKVYFGELTFYPWSGYINFTPNSFNYELGRKLELPKEKVEI